MQSLQEKNVVIMTSEKSRYNNIVEQLSMNKKAQGHFLFGYNNKFVLWDKALYRLGNDAEKDEKHRNDYVTFMMKLISSSTNKGVVVDMELERKPNFTIGEIGNIPMQIILNLSKLPCAKSEIDCLLFSNNIVRDGDIISQIFVNHLQDKFRDMYVYYWQGKSKLCEWIRVSDLFNKD